MKFIKMLYSCFSVMKQTYIVLEVKETLHISLIIILCHLYNTEDEKERSNVLGDGLHRYTHQTYILDEMCMP